MTPGLARGPPFPAGATKKSIVAVASLENPSVPRVVGVCEIDVSSLQQVQGAKGHAVRGYHWDGDEIWGWSQSGKPGSDAPDMIEGWDPPDVLNNLLDKFEGLSMAEHDRSLEESGVIRANEDREVAVKHTHRENTHDVNDATEQETAGNEVELSVKGSAFESNIRNKAHLIGRNR